MRISDWSSDVCSSDLGTRYQLGGPGDRATRAEFIDEQGGRMVRAIDAVGNEDIGLVAVALADAHRAQHVAHVRVRGAVLGSVVPKHIAGAHRVGIGYVEREHATAAGAQRADEHTSEHQSLMRSSYAVFCLKKKK